MYEVGNIAESIRQGLRDGTIKVDDSRYECAHCFNSGFRQIRDPEGTYYIGVVRCNECNYWQYRRQKAAV